VSDKTLEWEMIHEWGFLDPNMADTATEYVRSKIAEAVAAERERCEDIAEKWRKTWDALAREFQDKDIDMAKHAALKATAAWQVLSDIRARAGGEQTEEEQ